MALDRFTPSSRDRSLSLATAAKVAASSGASIERDAEMSETAGRRGAGRGGRTLTSRSSRDFESRASASSAIPAGASLEYRPRQRTRHHANPSPNPHPIDGRGGGVRPRGIGVLVLRTGPRGHAVRGIAFFQDLSMATTWTSFPRRSSPSIGRVHDGIAGMDLDVQVVQFDTGGDPGRRARSPGRWSWTPPSSSPCWRRSGTSPRTWARPWPKAECRPSAFRRRALRSGPSAARRAAS